VTDLSAAITLASSSQRNRAVEVIRGDWPGCWWLRLLSQPLPALAATSFTAYLPSSSIYRTSYRNPLFLLASFGL